MHIPQRRCRRHANLPGRIRIEQRCERIHVADVEGHADRRDCGPAHIGGAVRQQLLQPRPPLLSESDQNHSDLPELCHVRHRGFGHLLRQFHRKLLREDAAELPRRDQIPPVMLPLPLKLRTDQHLQKRLDHVRPRILGEVEHIAEFRVPSGSVVWTREEKHGVVRSSPDSELPPCRLRFRSRSCDLADELRFVREDIEGREHPNFAPSLLAIHLQRAGGEKQRVGVAAELF